MGALEDKLHAILDGARDAASVGFGDELSPEISTMLPGPNDPEGMTRNYAAGSAETDMRNNMRDESAELERKYPKTYGSGKMLAAAPAALALPAAGIAESGLLGGLMGAIRGAGEANGEDVVKSAAKQAGTEGLMGMFGSMIPEAVQGAKGMLSEVPQLVAAEAKAVPGGVQINREVMTPPRGSSIDLGDMPTIPKAGKTGIRESMIPEMEDLAQAGDDFTSASNKKLVERSLKKQASRTEPINRDVEYIKNFADQKEAGVAARAKQAPKVATSETEEVGIKTPVMRKPKTAKVVHEEMKVGNLPKVQATSVEEGPDYFYHATPSENIPGIRETGLSPKHGGKNYKLKKNQGVVYFSPETEAKSWVDNLSNFGQTGEMSQLRTKALTQSVPGANPGLRQRTDTVPPGQLELMDDQGNWKKLLGDL